MTPRSIAGLEELAALAGSHLGTSKWHTIGPEDIRRFADLTGDQQWIHVSEERAAAGPYGGPIAHGMFVLSLLPVFGTETYRIATEPLRVNYGFNRVRFTSAVPAGARVRDAISLLSTATTQRGMIAITLHEIELEGADRLVCIAESVTLFVS